MPLITMLNDEMANACKKGDKKLVELLIEKGANEWNQGLAYACWGGHKDLVELIIKKGADNWNQGLVNACYGGHKELAELMISKGAYYWNYGLNLASDGHHVELILLMIEKGAVIHNLNLLTDIHIEYLIKKNIPEIKSYKRALPILNNILLIKTKLSFKLPDDLVNLCDAH